jgi:uncharacterized protein (DUF2336 family)
MQVAANSNETPIELTGAAAPDLRLRDQLLRRLIDVAATPGTAVSPHERSVAADILSGLLDEAGQEWRINAAKRLAPLQEVPRRLLLKLGVDDWAVAQHILTDAALSDADLLHVISATATPHRRAIAQRRKVADPVADALVAAHEVEVDVVLAANAGASIPDLAMDVLVERSRDDDRLIPLLVRRPELQPAQALTLFWWAGPQERRAVLTRFAPERMVLLESCADLFRAAAREGWQDPLVRKALQVIERRQRNRAAIARSPYESLEEAIEEAARTGITRQLVTEISHLAGVKPVTGARILSDAAGEPIAVMCKAVGLRREHLRLLWLALKRPVQLDDAEHPMWSQVVTLFDTLATAKAQTALRYWNWSLTTAFQVLRQPQPEGTADTDSERKRAAAMFGRQG